ncbi:MAG TPA: EsaB/YukD family protein [Gemmatimonadales bacterium]|nr:EsaB/YukD family protein [Gemmatimonadales bacterium]
MSATLPVRVMVTDTWDEVSLELPPDTPVASLKQRALELCSVTGDPAEYIVKYRGARVLDESQSLAQAGIVKNAPLIVLNRRRQPVR